MIYYLAWSLKYQYSFFNILSYTSSRIIFAALTALIITLSIGPKVIATLSKLKFGQVIRNCGPESHLKKSGTTTMGGIMIIIAIVVSVLLWSDLSEPLVWYCIFVLISFAVIGFYDDWLKITKKSSAGLAARKKYIALSIASLLPILSIYFFAPDAEATKLSIPFFSSFTPNLGILFIILGYLTLVGGANSVNLTDGLDGLAIGCIILVAIGLGVVAYLTGNYIFADYLDLLYIENSQELSIICAMIFGSGLGFLWFNAHPAQIFMGDVGSLALGGVLSMIAVLIRQEFLLVILGGIFVIETLSVIIQVSYFNYSGGKRIFLMTPIHHHFEKKGLHENKVVLRFWIVGFILLALALATLKIR